MRTIREILLTEYIGAILAGVLIADAFGALIIFRGWSVLLLHAVPA